MIKKILLILFLFINITYTQEDNLSNDYILKFSTLDLLTGLFYRSTTVQFGLEKGISENISLNNEIGYSFHINNGSSLLSIGIEDSKGFTLESELRKYFSENKYSCTGQYLSIDILYRYLKANDNHWADNNSKEEYSTFRDELAVHLKYGYQNISKSKFTADYSIGIGWRYISSKSNNIYPVSFIEYEIPFNKPFIYGSKNFFSITAAIRIGFALK